MSKQEPDGFFVQSIYGAFSNLPLVQVTVRHAGEVRNINLSPTEARSVASNLLECAEAAEMDAIVIKWLTTKMNASEEQAAMVLQDFRKLREGN